MEKLTREVQNLVGVRLTPQQIAALQIYENELVEWNNRFNLTAIHNVEEIRTKHFLDSLSCLLVWRETPPMRLIDIGAGAGFPSLPIKILLPSIRLTLVDSVGKKVEFCKHVINRLGLDNVEVLQARAEELGQAKEHRERYDWAIARAVASLSTLVEYLLPLVKIGGGMLSQKGENGPAEAHEAEHASRLLGGHLRQLHQVTLPGVAEERYLIVIDKIAATPPHFPRRVGIPSKRPLK